MSTAERPPYAAPHDPNPGKPAVVVPAHACDTHAHVFGPGNTYPFIANGLYTPADALLPDFRHMLDTLGMERAVLVQPSIYGTNNDCMLEALQQDTKRLRGVAVIPFDSDTATIERLHAQGVRGVRCNIVDLATGAGELPLEPLRALAKRIKPFGWHVEFLMHVDAFPELDRQLADFPVECSFGHLGYVPAAKGTGTKGFQALLRLMRDGKAWVKLTAPYRLTLSEMPYADTDACAHALLEAAPQRLLWGSDWPHVMVKSKMPNDGRLFDVFAAWAPDAETRRTILVDNPARLYDFN
ncbi:MAG: amidohydrolase family protein [Burkholderiales bacterium]